MIWMSRWCWSPPTSPAVIRVGMSGGHALAGVGDEVCQCPFEQGGVSDDVRQGVVDVDVDVRGAGAEAADRRHDDLLHAGRPEIGDDR